MESRYSKGALLRFIDIAAEKGFVTANVAKNWRGAAAKLLNDLSAAEEADIRTVDFGIAARKVANREPGALSPGSLQSYKSRAATAVEEFVNWTDNPTTYKPRGHNGKSSKKQTSDRAARQDQPSGSNAASSPPTGREISMSAGGLPYPYPLRSDFLAQVVVPRDLTVEEAKRLGAFLLTIAVDYKPEHM